MMEITYNETTKVDFDALPEQSRKALATYGLAHFLGNVQASKIVSKIRGEVGSDASRDVVTKYRSEHAEQIKTWENECFDAAIKEMHEGKMGVRQGGPRLDPVEKRLRELLVIEATALVETVGLKLPKPAKDGEPEGIIQFTSGETRTRKQILDNLMKSKGEELRKQAQRDVTAAQKIAAQAASRAQGVADPTSLGI